MRTTSALPWALLTLLSTSATLVAPRPLGACSLADNEAHNLDPAFATDMTPPGPVTVDVVDLVHVEDNDDGGGCGTHVAGCGNYGVITLDLHAIDDAAPTARIGYQLRLVGGDAPRDLYVPDYDVRPFGTELLLYFHNDERDFAFDLEVRAVDLNGNVGPASIVSITH